MDLHKGYRITLGKGKMKARPFSEENQEVIIEKLVLGGFGLSRLASGKIVLVTGVVPGENVAVKAVRRKKDYLVAEPVAVNKRSPDRVPPPCPYYGQCGGCDLQHMAYQRQMAEKRSMLVDHFKHSGLERGVLDLVGAIVPSRQEFGYRQRIRLHVDDRSHAVGYQRKNSHRVVDIAACLIADSLLNTVLAKLRREAPLAVLLRQIEEISLLKDAARARVVAVFKWRRKLRPAERKDLEAIAGRIDELAMLLVEDPAGQQTAFAATEEQSCLGFSLSFDQPAPVTLRFEVEPGGFLQVNAGINQALIKSVLQWATEIKGHRILDLFCGMGNFAIPLSLVGEEVHGVDLQRAAIRAAERNALENHRMNCHFLRGSAQEGATQLLGEGRRFDTVILDPPRQGCSEVIDILGPLGAAHVIYISCDPATLSRDLALLAARHFRIREIKPFDMFPQTHHLEAAVLLSSEAVEA